MLRTLFAIAIFTPWTFFVIITGLPLSLISPDYFHNYARVWARFGLWLTGMRLEVEGLETLDPNRPVIYMANHLSNFDILALFASLPGQFRWLAKQELFRIPLFGFAMRRCGYIPVDRADRARAIESMKEAASRIQAGASVMIFPEGTRSPDGRLLPFKKGGFHLALHARVPIVPIAISGSREAMPKKELRIHPTTIRLRICPPVATSGLTADDRDLLIAKVRESISVDIEEQR